MDHLKSILIVGANGATGRLLVTELLDRGHRVKAIVRSAENFSQAIRENENFSIIRANVLDLSNAEIDKYIKECDAVASCLGHNVSFKGIFGPPYRLVTDATRRLCESIKRNNTDKSIRFVLMNTTANQNRDLDEKVSFAQQFIIRVLRLLLPPHVDNEKAADYLRTQVGQKDSVIEWVAVRPDGLTNEGNVSEYDLHPSPIRSAIFDPGKTSRINVGHFMAELLTNDDLWKTWKGQMPVIYNRESPDELS